MLNSTHNDTDYDNDDHNNNNNNANNNENNDNHNTTVNHYHKHSCDDFDDAYPDDGAHARVLSQSDKPVPACQSGDEL